MVYIPLPETWSEVALVSIARSGGTDIAFSPIVETIDIDEGDVGVDFIATVRGGRLTKKIPKEKTTITFEAYPVSIAAPNGLDQYFFGDVSDAGVSSFSVPANTRVRYQFRIALLWTTDVVTNAGNGTTDSTTSSYRYSVINEWLVSYKKSFTDGVLKATFKFEVAPFNSGGTGNIKTESAVAAVLPNLGSYTST
mgnify:CR=1 FL=1